MKSDFFTATGDSNFVTGPQNSFAPGQVNPALVMGKFTAGKQSNLHARCNIHGLDYWFIGKYCMNKRNKAGCQNI
jgi:hypothetical protein